MTTPDESPELRQVTDPDRPDRERTGPRAVQPAVDTEPPTKPTPTPPDQSRTGTSPRLPSRVGAAWLAAVLFALVLLLLLIFVLQNGQKVEVSFFGAHAHTPMGVALLLAAVFGILLVAIPGSARIVQLRMRDRRRRRAEKKSGR